MLTRFTSFDILAKRSLLFQLVGGALAELMNCVCVNGEKTSVFSSGRWTLRRAF